MSFLSDFGPYLVGTAALLTSGSSWVNGRAQARKLAADGATQLVDAGIKLGTERDQDVKDRDTSIRDLQLAVQGLQQREQQRDRQAIRHERWDLALMDQVVALGGVVPGDPPPLFIDHQPTG